MAADSGRVIACGICVAAYTTSVRSRAHLYGMRRCIRRGRLIVVGRTHATDALGFDRGGSDDCREGDHRIAAAARLTVSLMFVPVMQVGHVRCEVRTPRSVPIGISAFGDPQRCATLIGVLVSCFSIRL